MKWFKRKGRKKLSELVTRTDRHEDCTCDHEARFHDVKIVSGQQFYSACRMIRCKCKCFELPSGAKETA